LLEEKLEVKEDQDVGRWIILRLDFGEIGWSDVDRIGLAMDRDKWRALVNGVMNLLVL
jgi:hypothetical protein